MHGTLRERSEPGPNGPTKGAPSEERGAKRANEEGARIEALFRDWSDERELGKCLAYLLHLFIGQR